MASRGAADQPWGCPSVVRTNAVTGQVTKDRSPGPAFVDRWHTGSQRAPGSVKLRAGGDSPRPVFLAREGPVDLVEFQDRR
ncbi:hypothetical protein KEM60_02261 [Austwickia sp. TVS 96-490-7B]|nr:hypothetical protein [Austwickia sp. TVS 96-490-7B]